METGSEDSAQQHVTVESGTGIFSVSKALIKHLIPTSPIGRRNELLEHFLLKFWLLMSANIIAANKW